MNDFDLTMKRDAKGNPYGVITRGKREVWSGMPWKVHDGSAQSEAYAKLYALRGDELRRLWSAIEAVFDNGAERIMNSYNSADVDDAVKDVMQLMYNELGANLLNDLKEHLMRIEDDQPLPRC